jgi:glutathione S-transferase
MPMDLLARLPSPPIGDALAADIRRIVAIWKDARARFGAGGQYLFGAFTNADAMYAPVATRFRTYAVDLVAFGDDGTASAYADTVLALPAIADWTDGAAGEMEERKTEAGG